MCSLPLPQVTLILWTVCLIYGANLVKSLSCLLMLDPARWEQAIFWASRGCPFTRYRLEGHRIRYYREVLGAYAALQSGLIRNEYITETDIERGSGECWVWDGCYFENLTCPVGLLKSPRSDKERKEKPSVAVPLSWRSFLSFLRMFAAIKVASLWKQIMIALSKEIWMSFYWVLLFCLG